MTSQIEQGLVNWLTDLVEPETAHVAPGASGESLPAAKPAIILALGSLEHAAGPLNKAELKVIVRTPVLAGLTIAAHRAALDAVRANFVAANVPDMSDAISATSEAHFTAGGMWINGSVDENTNDVWQTTYTVILGIVEA